MNDKQVQNLIKLYERAEKDLTKQIERALMKGNQTEYLVGLKKNTQFILADLRKGSREWCKEAIPQVYTYATKGVDKDIPGQMLSFGAIHQQAAQVLADSAFGRLEDMTSYIGRRVDDVYRALALENMRASVVGYKTWQQVARQYREDLAKNGLTGFTDRAGRKWNMRAYTEMVAITTTAEAHLEGTKNRILEHGYDLVKITNHPGECEKCRPWEGKVLSLTGKTPGYPTLAEAKAAGLFHPRCKHAYGMHVDLDAEIAALEDKLGTAKPKKKVSNEVDYKNVLDSIDEYNNSLMSDKFKYWKDGKLYDYAPYMAKTLGGKSKVSSFKEQANKAFDKFWQGGARDMSLNLDETAFLKVLDDDVFKSANEVLLDRGDVVEYMKDRIASEKEMFGDSKPIYGYYDGLKPDKFKSSNKASLYGSIKVNLNKEALKDRTTFTLGDSLDSKGYLKIGKFEEASGDFVKIPKHEVKGADQINLMPYMELQFHGPVKVSDIASVELESYNEDIVNKLERLGIKWTL